jgi:glycyl-tRNA synthetase beta chain
MHNYLFEILTEELPSSFVSPALKDMKSQLEKGFSQEGITYDEIETFGTPRRLALLVSGLPEAQPDREVIAKGPSVKAAFDENGNFTKAALGFAKAQNVAPDSMQREEINGVEYVIATKKITGRRIEELIVFLITELLSSIRFPKNMRWGMGGQLFARPIHSMISLLDARELTIQFADIVSGRATKGHRFLAPESILLESAENYVDVLHKNYVVPAIEKRQAMIKNQITDIASSRGFSVEIDKDLLDEVTNLVEVSHPIMGSFAEEYLQLPEEVLITTMRENQRYFPVRRLVDGALAPYFITIANGDLKSDAIIREGNEKVLRARLADALFFLHEDTRRPLSEKVDGLKKVTYHEKLGSIFNKVERISAIAEYLRNEICTVNVDMALLQRAVQLSKADLTTHMVFEFPELQGIMGRYYAEHDKENPEIALALDEYYRPRHANDSLPSNGIGKILALADKIDTLTACFAIGIVPTGSQDPYALRRSALGVLNIIQENNLNFSLRKTFEYALNTLSGQSNIANAAQTLEKLMEFVKQRIVYLVSSKGIPHEIVEAITEISAESIIDVMLRAEILQLVLNDEKQLSTLLALKRAINLSRKRTVEILPDSTLINNDAERLLYNLYVETASVLNEMYERGQYQALFDTYMKFSAPIDRFFDEVMVMDKNDSIRENRLALLATIVEPVLRIADVSKLI